VEGRPDSSYDTASVDTRAYDAYEARLGLYPIATLEKQLLIMIGNLV
jgi:hypothetical protein